jgi:hypothetical protein
MTSGGDWMAQARLLMETLKAAVPADPAGAAAQAASAAREAASGTAAQLSGDCRWCPLCQAAAMVRGERPELSAALADILAATATALRQYAGEPAQAEPPAPEEPAEAAPAPVQRIELS